MQGFGCGIGPFVGSVVYEAVGYSKTFYIFGVAMAPASFLVLLFKKKQVEDGSLLSQQPDRSTRQNNNSTVQEQEAE